MKVAITGATGYIGRAIVRALRARGDAIVAFTRSVERARGVLGEVQLVAADLETPGDWQEALGGADAVLHLAGENIGGRRWNGRVKQLIRDSRVEATRVLVEGIAQLPAERRPTALVVAGGVDYYAFADGPADFDDDDVTERDPPGDTFLARVSRDAEAEAVLAEELGLRVVRMRSGLVFGPGGSALDRMSGPFRFFVGGRLGSGRQWMSWIHLDDVVAAYLAAASDARWRGPINLVAPEAARASDVAKAIGAALHRPSLLPAPGFAVKAVAGEAAEYLLHGRKVVPAALEALGFAWRHPTLREAVSSVLGRTSERAGSGSAATP